MDLGRFTEGSRKPGRKPKRPLVSKCPFFGAVNPKDGLHFPCWLHWDLRNGFNSSFGEFDPKDWSQFSLRGEAEAEVELNKLGSVQLQLQLQSQGIFLCGAVEPTDWLNFPFLVPGG
jgi:hypothetical protein